MIAVIADDFTGAAELAGIALRYGYKISLDTSFQENYDVDVLILATNMRAMEEQSAMKTLRKLLEKIKRFQISVVFLKLDSVFRGHVKGTLNTSLQYLQKSRVLFIPANPSLGRTITDGIYYYHQKPLMDAGFFPIAKEEKRSSRVLDLIGKINGDSIWVSSIYEQLNSGIVIGNASNEDDIVQWATKLVNSESIPAGGASFFEAIIKKSSPVSNEKNVSFPLGKNRLYLCGSAHINSKNAIRYAKENGAICHFMPENMFCAENKKDLIKSWANAIISEIKKHHQVIVAINKLLCKQIENLPNHIESAFAELVSFILTEVEIQELIIEGGATAHKIISQLGLTTFFPAQELAPGVIRMRTEQKKDMFITVKPGSYQWPVSLWNFQKNKN